MLAVGAQVVDERAGTGDETACAGERLRHAAADNIHVGVEAEVIHRAASLPAEHAEAVGVVDDVEAIVFFGDGDELRQAGDVSLHRVDALGDHHLRGGGGKAGSDGAQVVGIVVGETLDVGGGQADAVPEARVDVFIGKDDVTLLGEGGDAGETRQITGGVDVAGLAAEEIGELFLQLDVIGAGAVGDACAGGAGAPFEEGGAAGLDDLGVE